MTNLQPVSTLSSKIDPSSQIQLLEYIKTQLDPQQLEDRWSRHFRFYDFFMTLDPRYIETIKDHVNGLRDFKTIIDTGCGTGNLTLELLKEGHEITAIDGNELALSFLKTKSLKYKDKIKIEKKTDVQAYLTGEQFDAASSMFVIPFVPKNLRYFARVYHMLKPGGKLTISAWAPVPDTFNGVIGYLEKFLEGQGILKEKKYGEYWQEFKKTSQQNAGQALVGTKKEDLEELLLDIGFEDIKQMPDNYSQYAYSLSVRKPTFTNK